MNNTLIEYLVFDDVAASVLEEESRCKNKGDRQASLQQTEALTMVKGRLTKCGLMGVTVMINQNQEVRRKSGAVNMVKLGT